MESNSNVSTITLHESGGNDSKLPKFATKHMLGRHIHNKHLTHCDDCVEMFRVEVGYDCCRLQTVFLTVYQITVNTKFVVIALFAISN